MDVPSRFRGSDHYRQALTIRPVRRVVELRAAQIHAINRGRRMMRTLEHARGIGMLEDRRLEAYGFLSRFVLMNAECLRNGRQFLRSLIAGTLEDECRSSRATLLQLKILAVLTNLHERAYWSRPLQVPEFCRLVERLPELDFVLESLRDGLIADSCGISAPRTTDRKRLSKARRELRQLRRQAARLTYRSFGYNVDVKINAAAYTSTLARMDDLLMPWQDFFPNC